MTDEGRRYMDEDGDGAPDLAPAVQGELAGAEPPVEPVRVPLSPKVVAATVWGFVGPVLLAVVFALVGYFGTDDGRALTAGWPVLAQVAFFAAVAALSSGLAGYRTGDAAYRRRRAELGK